MMLSRALLFTVFITCLFPASAFAADAGFFVGLDLTGGKAFGSSDQTDGGAAFGGGGVVENVDFGDTVGIGGHLGYRINEALSVSLAYQHIWGDVSWDANFPAISSVSAFEGTAVSDMILANVSYDMAVSDAISISPKVGAGLTFNTLSGVVETLKSTGQFLSDVSDATQISPVAQVEIGLRYNMAPNMSLNLGTALAYTGGFKTNDTRSGNLGVTPITPYEIDDVWRASLGASIDFDL
jgi:hypothetical protein